MRNVSIRVVAPARWLERGTYDKFVHLLSGLGAKISVSDQCFWHNGQLAGTDQERADAFIDALNDEQIDVIWCARGGYGSSRILDLLDIHDINKNKIIIGYSDECSLLQFLSERRNIVCVHGPMVVDLEKNNKIGNFSVVFDLVSRLVRGEGDIYSEHDLKIHCRGHVEDKIIPFNLSVLTRLIGTKFEPRWGSCILLVEDIEEYLYSIDRMFWHLKESRLGNQIAGLIIGQFSDTQDNEIPWGETVEEIAVNYFHNLGIPIVSGFLSGHGEVNMPIIFGQRCELSVEDNSAICRLFAPEGN